MDDRLKERLTGAILLVVLVVVLVPAMFRGDRPGSVGATAASDASPQQLYTIDLKGAAPAAPDPVPAAAAQPATLPADAPAPVEEPVKAAAPAGVAASAPVQPAVAMLQPPASVLRPATTKPPVKPAPAAAEVARSVPVTGGFAVQVGSFSKRENAAVMVKQAAKKGARLMVAGPDDHGLFRVRTAMVRTRQDAVALQEKLRAQGYKGLVGAVN